jgi:hypothetical protein
MSDFLNIEERKALADYMPKVYSEISTEQLPDFLSRQKVPASRIRASVDALRERGRSYLPELNSNFYRSLQPGFDSGRDRSLHPSRMSRRVPERAATRPR